MSEPILGRVLWYELLTTDVDAAEKFYTPVVGWTTQPFEGSPERYDMFAREGGTPVAGVMRIPQGMNFPPHWGMYVGVPNLEEGVARVERLKGSALSPIIEVPTVGRMRTMRDPQGAAFSIYQPNTPPREPEHQPGMGEVSWHELYTSDAEAALAFYTELFGWRATESMDMGDMGKYHMFGRGVPLGGMMKLTPQMEGVPPHWGFYFHVADVHAGAERVKANGGSVLNGPMEVPGGDWIVNAMDPQGAGFSLHHTKK